jgi:hypothetical protein
LRRARFSSCPQKTSENFFSFLLQTLLLLFLQCLLPPQCQASTFAPARTGIPKLHTHPTRHFGTHNSLKMALCEASILMQRASHTCTRRASLLRPPMQHISSNKNNTSTCFLATVKECRGHKACRAEHAGPRRGSPAGAELPNHHRYHPSPQRMML